VPRAACGSPPGRYRDVGKTSRTQAERDPSNPTARSARVHDVSLFTIAVVGAPQRDQPSALSRTCWQADAPFAAGSRVPATPASRHADCFKLNLEIFKLHVIRVSKDRRIENEKSDPLRISSFARSSVLTPQSYPISCAAWRYQSARYGEYTNRATKRSKVHEHGYQRRRMRQALRGPRCRIPLAGLCRKSRRRHAQRRKQKRRGPRLLCIVTA